MQERFSLIVSMLSEDDPVGRRLRQYGMAGRTRRRLQPVTLTLHRHPAHL
ncbi:hypothetical protein GCM10027046_30330 [Uliginosibacterium flavum]